MSFARTKSEIVSFERVYCALYHLVLTPYRHTGSFYMDVHIWSLGRICLFPPGVELRDSKDSQPEHNEKYQLYKKLFK